MPGWSLEENVVLFAWLDFCNVNEIDYLETIEDRLMEINSTPRSKHAAREHLRIVQCKYRSPDEDHKSKRDEIEPIGTVLRKGSGCIKYAPREMKQKIKSAFKDYEEKYDSNAIRNLLGGNPAKSDRGQPQVQIPARKSSLAKTRIVPKSLSEKRLRDEMGNFKKRGAQEEKEDVSRKKQCLKRYEVILLAVHENTAPMPQEQTQPKKKAQSSKRGRSKIAPESRFAKPVSSHENPITRATTWTANMEMEDIHPDRRNLSADRQYEKITTTSVKSCQTEGLDDQVGRTLENRRVRDKEDIQINDAEIRAIREQWICDHRKLHGKIENLERTKMELEAKVANLEAAAIQVRSAGRDSLAYEIGQKNMEIWKLNEKIHQQFEVPSFKKSEAKCLPPSVVENAMNEIRLELAATNYFTHMLSTDEWFDGDLEHLVNSAFAAHEGSMEGKINLRKLEGILGPSAVFSVLAITALRDWVFLTDFPHIELGSLSLIESYRNIAFIKGGWDELRRLDFGAFKEYMKKPYFEDILDRTAKQLACRLSRTLSFLFGDNIDKESHDYSFHTWGEDSDSWEERRIHYEKLFHTALELKSQSVITEDVYIFEILSTYINKPFDESNVPKGSWLRLSISAYRWKTSASRNEKEGALVQTRNFQSLVADDWFCDYRKDIYLDVNESYQTQMMSQSSRNGVGIGVRSGNRNPEKDVIDSRQPILSKVAGIVDPKTDKVSQRTRNIRQLPRQPNHEVSAQIHKGQCRFCMKDFRTIQGLSSHYRKKSCRQCGVCHKDLPTADDLQQHIRSRHMQQSKESGSEMSVMCDLEGPPPKVTSAPKQRNRSYIPTKINITRTKNLDACSISASETVKNRKADSPGTIESQIVSASKKIEISDSDNSDSDNSDRDDSDSDDSESEQAIGRPCSNPHLSSTRMDDRQFSPGKTRANRKFFDATSDESEFDEPAIAERNHTRPDLLQSRENQGEEAIEASHSGKLCSSLQKNKPASSRSDNNRDTLETGSKKRAIAGSYRRMRGDGENDDRSSSRGFSTDNIDPIDHGTAPRENTYDSKQFTEEGEDNVYGIESPRLKSERRASQCKLGNPEEDELDKNEAGEDKDIELDNTKDIGVRNYENSNTTNQESTEPRNISGSEMGLMESIEFDPNEEPLMGENEMSDLDSRENSKMENGDADNEIVETNNHGSIELDANETAEKINDESIKDSFSDTPEVENGDSIEGAYNKTAETEFNESTKVNDDGNIQGRDSKENEVAIDKNFELHNHETAVAEHQKSLADNEMADFQKTGDTTGEQVRNWAALVVEILIYMTSKNIF